MRCRVGLPLLALIAACATDHRAPLAPDAPSLASGDHERQKQIVVLRDGENPAAVARAHGVTAVYVYRRVLNGFAGALSEGQRANLAADPRVLFVGDDRSVALIEPVEPQAPLQAFTLEPFPQVITPNMIRVGVDASATADIDGVDEGLDVDIGILDTGIDLGHGDLNVAGGRRFANGPGSDFEDCHGHGSHVTGIAAGRDNAVGIVGVAPGARLWSTPSTWPSAARILSSYLDNLYIRFSGTSMASPHVAGAAALLIASSSRRLSPAEVKRSLIRNAQGVARNDPDGDPDPVVYVGRF